MLVDTLWNETKEGGDIDISCQGASLATPDKMLVQVTVPDVIFVNTQCLAPEVIIIIYSNISIMITEIALEILLPLVTRSGATPLQYN
jgi:hypothetical protein